jgi:hypothetical protein
MARDQSRTNREFSSEKLEIESKEKKRKKLKQKVDT